MLVANVQDMGAAGHSLKQLDLVDCGRIGCWCLRVPYATHLCKSFFTNVLEKLHVVSSHVPLEAYFCLSPPEPA